MRKGLIETILFLILISFNCENVYAKNPYKLHFPDACKKGQNIIIALVGDIILQQPLQYQASTQGFESLWQEAVPYLQRADIAYGNIEGPLAPIISPSDHDIKPNHKNDRLINKNFSLLSNPPDLAQAMKESGFDIASTANNHSLDRYTVGIDRTIETLKNAKIKAVGTRPRHSQIPLYTLTEVKGITVAWIACTEHTNDMLDHYHQVLYCNNAHNRKMIVETIQQLRHEVDAIIVTPHWGQQYQHDVLKTQETFAKMVLDEGASAVVGHHPHVLQPIENYVTEDNRVTLIAYSLGNFVSHQGTPKNRTTVMLFLGLTKTPEGTVINGVRFLAMYMQNRNLSGNIYLQALDNAFKYRQAHSIISTYLPPGNQLSTTDPLVTNPECSLTTLVSQQLA